MQTVYTNRAYVLPSLLAVAVLLFCVACGFAFSDAFAWMFNSWMNYEEYSHGIMIPAVSLYLIWSRREQLSAHQGSSLALGLAGLVLACAFYILMQLATVHFGVLLAFLLALYSVIYLCVGWQNFKVLMGPLGILLFMLPLPNFITNNLSAELQLISSQLGVAFIRLFDISVYLEGNVIDLGSYKLQVVDACSGLRYLFPLMALGFILVYIAKLPLWQKIVLFVSTVPITVIMNSLRIGAIGVSVEYWGPEMAEGILHDVEGWFMFMASLAVLLLEMKLLMVFSGRGQSFSDAFSQVGEAIPEGHVAYDLTEQSKRSALILLLASAMLATGYLTTVWANSGSETPPQRLSFNHFPLFVGDWQGTPGTMEQIYIDELKFDDYILADYRKGSAFVNFYVAYYGSQRSGQSAHSPRSCIPGGGWQIHSIEKVHLGGLYLNSQPLLANRVLIQKGQAKQAVYYWFQQRGRIVTNEYLVKWYLFWDALNINRTDGAMVRLSVPLVNGEGFDEADRIVEDFVQDIQFKLPSFIPGA